MVVAGPQRLDPRPGRARRGVARRAATSRRSPAHSRPSTVAGSCRRSAAVPVHRRPVHPAVVVARAGSSAHAVVVAQAELVAHVDRAAGRRGRRRSRRAGACGGRASSTAIASPAASACSRPASEAAVPLVRASPVRGSGWKRAPRANEPGEVAGVEVGQEAAVQVAVLADRRRVLLGDRPADVVVAAHVGHPARAAAARGGIACSVWVRSADAAARRARSTAAP